MKKRIYVGAGVSVLVALVALVVVSLARAGTATTKDNIPDPPLTTRLSVNSDKVVNGVDRIRLMLMARSATDMPVPGVKVYLRVYTRGDVRFLFGLGRKLGANESLVKSKSVKNEWIWSMYSAPANTGAPARLPLQFFVTPVTKDGQGFSLTVWGRTIEGSKPTPQQTFAMGVA